MSRERVLVIEHERSAPAGLLGEWLERRGAEVLTAAPQGDGVPARAPGGYELIVALGSEESASDDTLPWLASELALLRAAVAAGVPVLGICFGSQLLARALGAEVSRAARPEIGWLTVRSRDQALIPAGPWFQWHFDTFAPPPGATLLASSDCGPQAFVRDRCLGLQFHPEVDAAIVAGWAASGRRELEEQGLDAQRLVEQTRAQAAPSRRLAMQLFDAVHARITGPGGAGAGAGAA
jgi:GMP synthase-like glutamine amidotransferase